MTTSSTIEYGQYWSFGVVCDWTYFITVHEAGNSVVASTSTPSGYTPSLALYSPYTGFTGSITAPYDVAPLGAGTYTFSISGSGTDGTNTYTGMTPTPATLTVEKAKLGMEVRVLADPNNSTGAIVTAKFTGRFAEEYQSSFFPGAAVSPAGTWAITIKDAAGETAIQQSIERAAGDDVLATSFYWPDAEPGEQYTATAEFTPTGTSAANFTVTAAQPFSYTAPAELRPTPTSTATARPDASLPEPTGFGIPLWALITLIALILGLGALVTILSVRLNRQRTPNSSSTSAQSR